MITSSKTDRDQPDDRKYRTEVIYSSYDQDSDNNDKVGSGAGDMKRSERKVEHQRDCGEKTACRA